jgi:hypothetical protein
MGGKNGKKWQRSGTVGGKNGKVLMDAGRLHAANLMAA